MPKQNLQELVNSRHHATPAPDGDVFAKAREFQKIVQTGKEAGLYPYYQPLECNEGPEVHLNGKKAIMLGSNNYLGLTTHPKVREAAIDAIRKYGTSMTGSRLLNGTLELHETFEQEIAQFVGKKAALVFTTGYQVNLGIITAFADAQSTVFMDKMNHASLFDGVQLSGAKLFPFRHNNLEDLERGLSQIQPGQGKFVAVDGVFSMEGDIIDLPNLVTLCSKYNARLMVDDAHALGVLGERGEGTSGHFGLTDRVDLIMSTFSKSLASSGGYVAGDPELIDYIKHFGRSMVFSASITPSNLAAAREALKVLQAEPERIQIVQENARKIRNGLASMGWQVGQGETPIIPVYIGNDLTTLMVWRDLLDAGVYVNPVLYPAVGKDEARLRISTMASHTDAHLTQALEIFELVGKRNGIFSEKNVQFASR